MAGRGFPTWRTVFRRIHLWIGVGTAALIVPIALSGTVLIFSDEIDNALHPSGIPSFLITRIAGAFEGL